MELPRGDGLSSSEVADLAAPLLAAARERAGVRRVALFWRDDDRGAPMLRCVATAAATGPEGWVGERLAGGTGMAWRAVGEGRPVWTPDLLADPQVPVAAWLRDRLEREGLRVVAAAPVRVDGVVRGALGFLDPAGRTFHPPDLARLAAESEALGAALRPTTDRP